MKKTLGTKTGILSFKIDTVRHASSKVQCAFDNAGFGKQAPSAPNDASAFLSAVADMHARGDNPKTHGTKQPLIPGYRVSFKKVNQTDGKREIVANVNVQRADQKGSDAPCKQVITYANGHVSFSRPTGLPLEQYDDQLMVVNFLACLDECRKIDSEDVRSAIHRILPAIRPFWINGRIVCFYEETAHDTAMKVAGILNDLGCVTMAVLLDITEENQKNLGETFVRSMGENIKNQLREVQTALKSDKDIRGKTLDGFGKNVDTLKATIGYYQNLLGVANDAIQDYTSEIESVERGLIARLTGMPVAGTMMTEGVLQSAEDPFAGMVD